MSGSPSYERDVPLTSSVVAIEESIIAPPARTSGAFVYSTPHPALMTASRLVRSCVSSLLTLLALAVPATAQNSRADVIAAQQAEKAKSLGPEQPNAFERGIIRVMRSPLFGEGDGFYPWVGSVFAGSGLSGGPGYIARLPEGMRVNALAGISINGSHRVEGTFTGPRLAGRTLRPRVSASYVDAKRVAFYGLGPDTADADRIRYEFTPRTVDAELVFTPTGWLELDGGFRWLAFGTDGGEAPANRLLTAPGFAADLRYQVSRGTVALDTRTSPGYSRRGSLLRATHELYDERTGQPFDYRQTELEAVQLVPLVNEQFVLAFRGMTTVTHADGDDDVPFPLLPHIGGGNTVRGLQNRRFADRNRAVLTAEYRWLPSRSVDMAVFLDAGQVGETREQLRLKDFETAWGIGMRIHGPTFTALRIEGARSSRGFVLIFAGGPAF